MTSPLPPHDVNITNCLARVYDSLQPLVSHPDDTTLRRLVVSACRAVYFLSNTSSEHNQTKHALRNVLGSAGIACSDEHLQRVHQALLGYISSIQNTFPSRSQEFEELTLWNLESSLAFDQLLLTSHAGRRYTAQSFPQQNSTATETSGSAAPSQDGPSFSSAWLRLRCATLPSVKTGNLTPSEMALSVHALLADQTLSDDAIQGHLFDAFGGDFDAVAEVLARRELIQRNSDAILADCNQFAEIERLGPHHSLQRQRGVASRHMEQQGRERMSTQLLIHDRTEDAPRRNLERASRRLARAGMLPSDDDPGMETLQVSLGGSVYEERQKAFPGVEVDRDTSIGAVDKTGLPKGSTREVGKGYEEIFVPSPPRNFDHNDRVNVSSAFREHPEFLQAMKGVASLNPLQSAVYPVAFNSDENLLVCAPTGAGKTNVALLTIFRELVAVKTREQVSFKVVYVAPMKALAAEITEKFGKRLSALNVRVREFTGDMSLSRSEAMETDVLVTTPEKWDVVTRKSGSDLGNSVTLFIIDEIHLLHDDRGAVLESIVARTLRLSETAQRRIRLVGLSATLPNYVDVGSFMRVNPDRGLFHFDGSHRPVPLSQTFIGISEGGSSNSNEARRRRQNKLYEMAWKKIKSSLQRGHQAMIFVHSRKGTSSAAREMLSRATQDASEGLFTGSESSKSSFTKESRNGSGHQKQDTGSIPALPTWATKEISKSKSSDIRELCARGIGIHNAGLPRSDRKLVEKLFSEGVLRLLCCTATLAWGINLPARSVVIMGTEVYNAEKGGFVQLGMLDVMQIFGRAGRPQFDTEGEGTIITMHEHLGKYLNMLTSSIPIESQLGSSASRLADHLNAEVVSGTVSSIGEGVRWLSYTYLSVRMPKNPLVYGISRTELEADTGLHSRRAALIEEAAKALDDAQMCRYDPRSGALTPTDLGRISSHFYVSHQTVVMWNDLLSSFGSEVAVTDHDWDDMYATVIHSVSCATEFQQMRSRQEEVEELDQLTQDACPLPLKSGSETREGKVAVLLQAHISRAYIRMSDLSYVVESSTRLLRAFFEISLRRGLPSLSLAALEIARASESRIWPFQHPLRQFVGVARHGSGFHISPETVAMIESIDGSNGIRALRSKTREELSNVVRAPKLVSSLQRVLRSLPDIEIENASIAPLTRTVLSINVSLFPNFHWNDILHGKSQSWWLWVEDLEENRIYLSHKIQLTKAQVHSHTSDFFVRHAQRRHAIAFEFTVPVFDPPSREYWVRIESERWHTGRQSKCVLPLATMNLPTERNYRSSLLDLRPLPMQAIFTQQEAACFEEDITHLTPLQSQAFHVANHSVENVLLSGPYGSGMEEVGWVTILSALRRMPSSMVVYLCSDIKTIELHRKRLDAFKQVMTGCIRVLHRQNSTFRPHDTLGCSIMLTTPDIWGRISRHWDDIEICASVSLVIFFELHLLMVEHEQTELILTRLRCMVHHRSLLTKGAIKTTVPRIVALCAPEPNAAQLAEWLGVSWETGLLAFGSEVREVPCELQVLGVAGDRYSSRMYSLSRPLYGAIQRYSPKKPVLIFVSSRRQALLTAQDLLRMASLNGRNDFVGKRTASARPMESILYAVKELGAQRLLRKGIALYHERLSSGERKAIEEVYNLGYAQILICTFAMSRALDVRSHQVIIKGTEYFNHAQGRHDDVPVANILQMIGNAGRPRKDATGYSIVFVHEPKKTLMKKILHEPLPLESRLLHIGFLHIVNDLVSAGAVPTVSKLLEWMSSTLFVRRLKSNPEYYNSKMQISHGSVLKSSSKQLGGRKKNSADYENVFCERLILDAIEKLELEQCVVTQQCHKTGHRQIFARPLGHISATHNVQPHSIRQIASHILSCETMQAVIDVISECDEVFCFQHNEMDDERWRSLLDVVLTQFLVTKPQMSKESMMKSLGISGWQESWKKRTKIICYSLMVDARLQKDVSLELRQRFYEVFYPVLNATFEIAGEFGSLPAVEACVRLSQSLYQGIPPHSDIWAICGSTNEALITKGREQGWKTAKGVRDDKEGFNRFLTESCGSENERLTISRRIEKFPYLGIERSTGAQTHGQLVVDVRLKTSGASGVSERLSRLAEKREGGYVLIASDEACKALICVQRFAIPEKQIGDGQACTVRLNIAMNEKRASHGGVDMEKVRVWVGSDVLMGVEAETMLHVAGI